MAIDIAGCSRVVDGSDGMTRVDIGAYESQIPNAPVADIKANGPDAGIP